MNDHTLRENTEPDDGAKKERGASLVEYALLVGLIAVGAIVAMRVFGRRVSSQFSTVAGQL